MDVSTARRRRPGIGLIAAGLALLGASWLWFEWLHGSGGRAWAEEHMPAVYTRSAGADYRPLYFLVGGALSVAAAVLGYLAIRRATGGTKWLGLVVGAAGAVATLAWVIGFVIVDIGTHGAG